MQYFFMFLDYLIPVLMIVSYPWWIKMADSKINQLSGLRTSASMQDEHSWKQANRLCGKCCLAVGVILLGFVVMMRYVKVIPMEWNSLLINVIGIVCMIGITGYVNQRVKKF